MATIKPLNNNVMFQFLDDTSGEKGRFTDKTKSGIILLPGNPDKQKAARWGKVLAVGPDVEGVVPGDFVLIEALMWMEGVKLDGVKMWKTDDSKILVVTNDESACIRQ